MPLRPPSTTPRAKESLRTLAETSRGRPAQINTDVILREVAVCPGSAVGMSYEEVRSVWNATCAVVMDTMSKGKGVHIPRFGIFSMQRMDHPRGLWGEKTQMLPVFCLLSNFCSAYSIAPSKQMTIQDANTGKAVPLSFSAVATLSGVPREAATDALKDIFRKVGEISLQGGALSIDLGVAKIVFVNHRYEVAWNAQFLDRVKQMCNAQNCRQLQQSKHLDYCNAFGGRSPPTWKTYRSDSALPLDGPINSNRGNMAAASPTPRKEDLQSIADSDRQSVASVRSHLSSALQYAQSQRCETPVRPHSTLPEHINHSPSRVTITAPEPERRAETSMGFSESNNYHDTHDPQGPASPTFTGMSTCSSRNERYLQRLRNKTMFRRMRNKAYVTAWEEQRKAMREAQQREMEADRKRGDILQAWARQEEENDRRTQQERRLAALKIEKTNKRLQKWRARQQNLQQPPAIVGGGEVVFGKYDGPKPVPADLEYLKQQSQQQAESRKRAKKEEDEVAALQMTQAINAHKAEIASLRSEKVRRQQEIQKEYDRQRQLVKETKEREKAMNQSNTGNYFFACTNAEQLQADELAEREARRQAALQVQEANRKAVEEACKAKKKDIVKRRNHENKKFAKLLAKDHDEEVEATIKKRDFQETMQKAWSEQIKQKREQQEREREEQRKASTSHAWRNESSDDEYEDYPRNRTSHLSSRLHAGTPSK